MSDFRVPVRTELSGPVFRKLERFANEHHTTVGHVVTQLVERAVVAPASARKPRARLDESTRDRIRQLRAEGRTQMQIAKLTGVSQPTVSQVLAGRA